MAEIASQGTLSFNIPGVFLGVSERCKTADIKDGRSTEVVMAIGVQRGAGFRRKQGGFEIDLEVYEEEGRKPEVDWHDVNNRYITFHLIDQNENDGFRYDYTTKISNIDRKRDAEGNYMQTIKCVCKTVDRT